MSETFTCAWCHETFNKETTEEAAKAEYKEIFEPLGYAPVEQECVDVVCDVCWQFLKPVGAQA